MLLHHAIKHEYGGWRVWVDTLAIVHSKVKLLLMFLKIVYSVRADNKVHNMCSRAFYKWKDWGWGARPTNTNAFCIVCVGRESNARPLAMYVAMWSGHVYPQQQQLKQYRNRVYFGSSITMAASAARTFPSANCSVLVLSSIIWTPQYTHLLRSDGFSFRMLVSGQLESCC